MGIGQNAKVIARRILIVELMNVALDIAHGGELTHVLWKNQQWYHVDILVEKEQVKIIKKWRYIFRW